MYLPWLFFFSHHLSFPHSGPSLPVRDLCFPPSPLPSMVPVRPSMHASLLLPSFFPLLPSPFFFIRSHPLHLLISPLCSALPEEGSVRASKEPEFGVRRISFKAWHSHLFAE